MISYNAMSDREQFKLLQLKEFSEYSELVTYCNQRNYSEDQLEGNWYYVDFDNHIVYHGSFGNYNSPGADSYTNANVFDDDEEDLFLEEVAAWTNQPEYKNV